MQRWYKWLHDMKKKVEEKGKEEQHQKLVSRMITRAEGRAGFIDNITNPIFGRGGVQVPEEEDDVIPLAMCAGPDTGSATRRSKI